MILTERELRNAAFEARKQPLYESYTRRSTVFDSAIKYDLFISHSFQDKELVAGLVYLFREAGYTVYIDWLNDSKLNRINVTPDTAKIIKNRIEGSKGTAYISTSNSTSSKWCPWELGVSDGFNGKVCILPIMNSSTFKGQEYLGLYPYLDYETTQTGKYDFWVTDQNNAKKYVSLRAWLNGKELYIHS